MEMITSPQVMIRKKREQSASDWKDGTTVHNYKSWVSSLKYLAHDNDDGEMIEENKNRNKLDNPRGPKISKESRDTKSWRREMSKVGPDKDEERRGYFARLAFWDFCSASLV
jgi:hypothetical protein